MTREKANDIVYAIVTECSRYDLYEWLDSWEITYDEFKEFLNNALVNANEENVEE